MVAVLDPAGLADFVQGPFYFSAEDSRAYIVAASGAVPAFGSRVLTELDDGQLSPMGGDYFSLVAGVLTVEQPETPAEVGATLWEGGTMGVRGPGVEGHLMGGASLVAIGAVA